MTAHRRAALALVLAAGTAAPLAAPAHAAAPAAPPPHAAAATPLRLDMSTAPGQPWSLRWTDRRGSTVLAAVEEGALSVQTSAGRATVTRVLSATSRGASPTVELATDRPGVTVRVSARRLASGDYSLSAVASGVGVTHVAIDFAADAQERFLGTGERSHAVDQRGHEVLNRVLDGPYAPKQGAVEPYIPKPGFSMRPDATYFPVPWVLSTQGYGVLLDNDEDSTFAFATAERPDSWRAEVESARLDMRVFAGPAPADALRRMTAAVGRQPAPSAPFVLGAWWQPHTNDPAQELAAQRAADVPISVSQTYTHYLPCGDQDSAREQAQTSALHAKGTAVTTYVNPMVCTSYAKVYAPGVQTGAFTKNPDGTPLVYRYSTASNFTVSQFDFSAAAGRDLFHSVLDETMRDGYDGWMEDFGEYTPDTAVSADGTPGPTMHNRYVEQYHATARDYSEQASRPLARFNRSGWTEAISESEIVWGGDPSTVWDFDGLESSVRQGLSMGLSGVSVWGSDIGGFFTWPDDGLTPELLNRWIEFGAFSGVMRLQAGGINIFGPARTQVTDPAVAPVWKRYTQLRTRMYPYVSGSHDAYAASGLPVMRHLSLAYPGDRVATGLEDQYLFGADLLVAPVVAQGASERTVYLPAGEWVDLWRSVSMADDGEITLGAATRHTGGSRVSVPAPVGQIPTQVRAGAVIPLLPKDVDTLADYGEEQLVTLAERSGQRELLAFPAAGTWKGTLGEGESMSSTLTARRWTLRVDARQARSYRAQAAMPDSFVPARVRVGGTRVDFSFDPTTRVLTFTAPLRARGHVEVDAIR
ncbi:TIM-barrel domain-containing protein [Actinomycetota bacterium]